MKMKIILTFAWVLAWIFRPTWYLVFSSTLVFWLLLDIMATQKGLSYFNELPNTLRFFLVCAGGLQQSVFGVFLILLGYFANDELIRRLYRQKGIVVLTGIDSSGKSTYAQKILLALTSKGLSCRILRFDKYLFLDKLSSLRKNRRLHIEDARAPIANTSLFSFLRPYLALVDNILFYLVKVVPSVAKREIVICDRFIWDNSVKHKALGYPTFLLFELSILLKPSITIVLDVPSKIAFERVEKREGHKRYSISQYDLERREFRKIARALAYPIIDTNESIFQTWPRIEALITEGLQK